MKELPLKKKNTPLKAHMILGPMMKYEIYGKFPWTILLHIVLFLVDVFVLFEFN